jgi:TAT (twin-arginine translocation) pathway signal sequence
MMKDILNKQVSRRNFLKYSGSVALLAIVGGFGTLIGGGIQNSIQNPLVTTSTEGDAVSTDVLESERKIASIVGTYGYDEYGTDYSAE